MFNSYVKLPEGMSRSKSEGNLKGTHGKADFSMRPDRIQAETLSKIRLVSDQRLVKQHQIFCVYIDQYRSYIYIYIISDI